MQETHLSKTCWPHRAKLTEWKGSSLSIFTWETHKSTHTHTQPHKGIHTHMRTLADELQMLHNVCGRYNFVFCCAIERATEAKNCAKEKEKELKKKLAKALNGMQHKWESSSFMPSNGICIPCCQCCCCCTDKAMPDRLDLLPTKSLLYIYRINLLAACEIQFQLAAQWIPFKQAHLLLNLQHFD